MKNVYKSLIVSSFLLSTSVMAETQLQIQSPHYGEKGWDVEATATLGHVSDWIYKTDEEYNGYLTANINVRYYGDKAFFIADEEEGLLLGYNISKDDDSAIDVLLAPRFYGFGEDNDELKGLNERDIDFHSGVRYTKYLGDSLYKIEASKDVSGVHDGFILSAAYLKEWQLKNWILTGTAAATYVSEDMADYYFGVSNKEANAKFPAHKVDATAFATLGVKAEYPLTENWVFQSSIYHFIEDGEVSGSPITNDKDNLTIVNAGIKYHF